MRGGYIGRAHCGAGSYRQVRECEEYSERKESGKVYLGESEFIRNSIPFGVFLKQELNLAAISASSGVLVIVKCINVIYLFYGVSHQLFLVRYMSFLTRHRWH